MSYHVFFSMSTGLSNPISVPVGTLAAIREHISEVEAVTGLKGEEYNGTIYWRQNFHDFSKVTDEALCETASCHNRFIRRLYEEFAFWSKHPFTVGKGHQDVGVNTAYPAGTASETITPEDAKTFWYALEAIHPPTQRWTMEYYRERMACLYEVMRGRDSEGVSFGTKALTTRQAAEVVNLFSEFLDTHGLRLDVPNGHDCLKSSYDGGYTWCENCGAVDEDDFESCVGHCKKRGCPLKKEYRGEE